jgi:hypothetical protein
MKTKVDADSNIIAWDEIHAPWQNQIFKTNRVGVEFDEVGLQGLEDLHLIQTASRPESKRTRSPLKAA